MFWAGGGLHRCRQDLLETSQSPSLSSAIVPVTPDAVLRLVLNLDIEGTAPTATAIHADAPPAAVGGSVILTRPFYGRPWPGLPCWL
jgi:hypothetical protein